MGVRGSAKRRRRRAPSSSAAGASTNGGKSRFPLNLISAAADDGNVLERESKRQRASTSSAAAGCDAAGAGVDDVISGLGDDVLVRILELLPDARDAVRTAALSRRWRGLWTRLPALHFSSGSRPEFLSAGTGSQRYVSFVNDALALRAAQTDPPLHRLEITFIMRGLLLQRCFEAAQGWIRHAARNEVKSLVLVLHPPIILDNKGKKKKFVMILDDLPSSIFGEAMRLALGGATVRLPAAATFASLANLSLEYLEFADGSDHLLNRLLSPACCPLLRKLRMKSVRFAGVRDLLLEAEALVELTWERLCWNPDAVRLRTPSLRVLHVVDCDFDELTLSAPRLEELLFFGGQPLYDIDIVAELSCVRSLKLQLMSHAPGDEGGHDDDDEDMHNGDYEKDMNNVAIRLLNFCTAATCLDIDLYILKKQDITEDRIPRLPQVTSLTVHVILSELHSFGVGIAHILPQCSNLEYLHIRCTIGKASLKTNLLCDHPDHWRPSHEIYLPHLKEAEFTGLVGTECELGFIQFMLTSTTQLQKATISFNREYNLTMNRINAFERIQMLGGTWTCDEAYLTFKWKPCLYNALQFNCT